MCHRISPLLVATPLSYWKYIPQSLHHTSIYTPGPIWEHCSLQSQTKTSYKHSRVLRDLSK